MSVPRGEVCQASAEVLIREHIPLVRSIAEQVHSKLSISVQLEDLVRAGTLGLGDAAEEFEPEMGAPFPIYLRHRVRGAILDSLREVRMDLPDSKPPVKTEGLGQRSGHGVGRAA